MKRIAILGLVLASAVRADFVYSPDHGTLAGKTHVTITTRSAYAGALMPRTNGVVGFDYVAMSTKRNIGDGGVITDGASDMVAPTRSDGLDIRSYSGVCAFYAIMLNMTVFWPYMSNTLNGSVGAHLWGGPPAANSNCSTLGSWTDRGDSSSSSPLNLSTNTQGMPSNGQFVSYCLHGKIHDSMNNPNGEEGHQFEVRRTWNGSSCTDQIIQLTRNGRGKVISQRTIPAEED